jgi:hypothetical protein
LTILGALHEVERCLNARERVCLEMYSNGDRVVLHEYPFRRNLSTRPRRVVVFGMTDERGVI